MNEKLQPTQNIVELQGLLVNNTLEVKTDKNGRKFIGGTLEINTGTATDECIIPVDCLQYELKKMEQEIHYMTDMYNDQLAISCYRRKC